MADDFFETNFESGNDLKTRMDAGGGDYDEEVVFLGDGDELQCAIATPLKGWVLFWEHYYENKAWLCWRTAECPHCASGKGSAQRRVMVGIYCVQRYKPATGQYTAKSFSDEGFKYIKLNATTADRFVRIANRRKGRLDDKIYVISRTGGGLDTKYDIDSTDDKPSKKMLAWPKNMDLAEKLRTRLKQEQGKLEGIEEPKEEDFDHVDVKPKRKRRGSK